MKRTLAALALAAIAAMPAFADGHRSASPEGASVYIVMPGGDGAVSSPVTVVFGLRGMGIAPAGVEIEGTGHHHLLLNRAPFGMGEFGEEEFDTAIPADDNHRHFGKGQTEVTLDLPPGEHTLQLVLGDAGHIPHDPVVMSEVMTITVE